MAELRQDVNLLAMLEPPEIEVYLPLHTLKKILIAWGVVLLLMLGLGIWWMYSTKGELDKVTAKRDALSKQLEQLKAQEPKKVNSDLQRRVAELTQNINSKNQLIKLLDKEDVDNVQGYSSYLKAMSEKIPKDVWVTEFIIGDKGILIFGRATSSDLIAEFASQLHENKLFSKLRFKHLDIDRDTKTGQISFELATSRAMLEKKE